MLHEHAGRSEVEGFLVELAEEQQEFLRVVEAAVDFLVEERPSGFRGPLERSEVVEFARVTAFWRLPPAEDVAVVCERPVRRIERADFAGETRAKLGRRRESAEPFGHDV